MVPITGNYYISFHNNGTYMTNTSRATPTQSVTTAQRKSASISASDNNLKNLLPSSKPNMLTSGKNLIPVKTLLKAESTAETILVLTRVSNQ